MHSNYPRAVHVTFLLYENRNQVLKMISNIHIKNVRELVIYLIDEKQLIAVNIAWKCWESAEISSCSNIIDIKAVQRDLTCLL